MSGLYQRVVPVLQQRLNALGDPSSSEALHLQRVINQGIATPCELSAMAQTYGVQVNEGLNANLLHRIA